jgi:predicted membrane channel-forming protein YqfA (hemolysin III family)
MRSRRNGDWATGTPRGANGVRTAMALLVVLSLAGCAYGPVQTLTWGETLGAMFAFFVVFAAVVVFIALFADITRRRDLSGGIKAVWVLALVVLPLVGSLIYIALRPKPSVKDLGSMKRDTEMSDREAIAHLNRLKAEGKITEADYEDQMRNFLP